MCDLCYYYKMTPAQVADTPFDAIFALLEAIPKYIEAHGGKP